MHMYVKRALDIVFACIAVVILSPLMAITAIAVKAESEGPALFKQDRLGLGGRVFKIYKFRSVSQGAEHTGSEVYSVAYDSRVTKVGRIIRATGIDELPQLFNIIKGDRGIIGTTKKNIDFSSVVTA